MSRFAAAAVGVVVAVLVVVVLAAMMFAVTGAEQPYGAGRGQRRDHRDRLES